MNELLSILIHVERKERKREIWGDMSKVYAPQKLTIYYEKTTETLEDRHRNTGV